jgi:anti-sigma-K factor RskA
MTCQECEELSGAYVLGALGEAEQEEVEAHLVQCADCKHLIQELQPIVDMLPLAVPQIEPSPRVKAQLMAKIRSSQPASIQQTRPQPQRIRSWRMPLVAIAAVLLLAFTGTMTAWNLFLQQQLAQLAPIKTSIQGTAQGTGAHGQITYLSQQNISIVVVQNLPALQGTQVYQGWVIQGKQPASIGVFNVQNGTASLDVQGDVRGYTAVAVSLEPGPQASIGAPKGPVIALSSHSLHS